MVVLWSARPGWLGKLGLLLLVSWLLVLILSVSYIFKNSPSSPYSDSPTDRDHAQRLAQIISDFDVLKKQNEALKNIILGESSKHMQGDHLGMLQERLDKASIYYDLFENNGRQKLPKNGEPSLEYEQLRRRIRDGVQEMWYYVNSELKNIKKNSHDFTPEQRDKDIQDALKNVWEHKKSLISDIDRLALVDGYQDWREKEAKDLSDLVQRRFKYLQNPSECDRAQKLVCSLNKGCGFGCQVHHAAYCFLVAYGTERTLILKSRGWRYHKDGWEAVFKPVSDTCLSPTGGSHANWPGDSTKQVVSLPIVDNVYPKPIYQPPGVPADIAPRLEKLHGHPIVWWVGQVLKYLLRPQENLDKVLEYSKEKMGFKSPIVGIHVRRTDKVGTEAAYHDIDEYMIKVNEYFDQHDVKLEDRRVFLASDDPKVIVTAKERYPTYQIIGDPEIAKTASVSRRYSDTSLQGIIVDIHLLSLCDYLVCTFSSQVCRVAYEIMQSSYPDAYNRFASLDDVYYYGGQNPHPHIARLDHTPRKSSELELKINDPVEVFGNHWNGYSKGRNVRTNTVGLYPSFKVRNPIEAVDFPKYPEVPIEMNKEQ
ncbi:alpha-(1,6)-fucosyltransferase isoform X1 [Diprion similis]|uniref:alpha-(1,6)-fucosyltransferase isoform X1 n=2 Tax=Diprion similis TaxID=362088 RepID=UPI001EF7A32F|nr:alpha-(1,6)-fucosyltransferase isoform X1 [Diprion similis]